jgi:hypothetical protein
MLPAWSIAAALAGRISALDLLLCSPPRMCQSARKVDPVSACNFGSVAILVVWGSIRRR